MTEDNQLRAGVIGVGTMGQHHARVYDEIAETELIGVADDDHQRAHEIGSNYGVRAFDVDELLDHVDIVSIAVPTQFHYDLAREAIMEDVDLLVEKPIVEDPERGRDLVKMAREKGVTLQVGHVERFNPATMTLQQVIDDLDVIAVEAERVGPPPERTIKDSAVLDLMIHDIDIVRSLTNSPLMAVDAAGGANGRHATATMEFGDGMVATLKASRVTQKKVRRLSVTAEECYVTVDYIDQSVEVHRQSVPEYVADDGDVTYRHESVVEKPAVDNGEPLKNELSSFAQTVREDSIPEVTGREGIWALEVAREIDEKAFETLGGEYELIDPTARE